MNRRLKGDKRFFNRIRISNGSFRASTSMSLSVGVEVSFNCLRWNEDKTSAKVQALTS